MDVWDARVSAYPPKEIFKRPFWLFSELMARIPEILASYHYDVVIFQRELISTLPTLEGFSSRPRILDVDDAIWLYKGGFAARNIARLVDHVVCGNQYIADYFSSLGKPVTIIPTPVDVARFRPAQQRASAKVIGWSGSSSGQGSLYGIEGALANILSAFPDWTLRIVSDQAPSFSLIPASRVEFVEWSEAVEVDAIAGMDIGLMPLDDTPWSKGKCSYKMLLYLACGVPVVVSDVGMNREVLGRGFVGYGVVSEGEWYPALSALINNVNQRKMAGETGRAIVVEHYAVDQAVEKWEKLFERLVGRRKGCASC